MRHPNFAFGAGPPVHPPGDDKAAAQYESYLEANDPRRDPEWCERHLLPEPDFPGDER